MPWSRYCLNHEHNISFHIVSLIQPLTDRCGARLPTATDLSPGLPLGDL